MAPDGSMRLNRTQSPSFVKYGYKASESGKYELQQVAEETNDREEEMRNGRKGHWRKKSVKERKAIENICRQSHHDGNTSDASVTHLEGTRDKFRPGKLSSTRKDKGSWQNGSLEIMCDDRSSVQAHQQ